jgi:hypothetical protein
MKVIAYDPAKVVMLFSLEEIVPLGGVGDPEVLEKVQGRYHFAKGPDLRTEDVAKNGYKFETGYLDDGNVRINDFSLFRDGIVINAPTTEAAEKFLDNVIPYLRAEFHFRDFITQPRKYFQSQIVVEFERSLAKLIRSFEGISSLISKRLMETYSLKIQMDFMRLDFDTDRTKNHALNLIQKIIIERRVGVPFDNERYFCAAPLRTSEHEALLREIEGLIP